MAIMQWVLLPALATHSTRLVCVAHTAVRSVAMRPSLLSVRAAVVAHVPGRPGIVGSQPRMDCISTCRMNELLRRQPPRRMNELLRRQPPHGQHECGVALDVALDGQTYHRVQRCHVLPYVASLLRCLCLLPYPATCCLTPAYPAIRCASLLRCTHSRAQCCHAAILALRPRRGGGGGTRPGEARNWGAAQPRSTCVDAQVHV